MSQLTIKIRRKAKAPRIGDCVTKAEAYRRSIFDPAGDIEALIEAYGAATVHRVVDRIVQLREQLDKNQFVDIELV